MGTRNGAPRARVRRPGPSFHFVAGKGGVGKTTLAAARAVDYAVGGRDVLCVSMDPAHSLADALSTTAHEVELTDTARPVALKHATSGRLRAMHLDADRALDRWLAERRRALRMLAVRGTHLDGDEIDSFLDLSLPGVDQLLALVELAHVVEALDPDIVVVDTAPTGHTLGGLEMLRALERLAEVLEGMRHAPGSHDAGYVAQSGDVDADDANDDGAALVAELQHEARALGELLRDHGRATWSWVTLADRASFAESKDGVAALERAGIAVDDVVVNRVITDVDEACSFCVGRAAAERPVLERIQRAFAGPARAHRTVHAFPLVDDEPRGEDALLALARSKAAPARVAARGATAARRTSIARSFAPSALAHEPRRLVIVTGTGGAGKTSVASSIALSAARADPERRVLLASADPAHSLGDVLDVPLGDGEVELPGTTLRARELDAAAAFAQAREHYRKLDRADVRDLFDLAPPGLDELLAIVSSTARLARDPSPAAARSLVVIDTAPTGHALRLLHMPAVALDWLNALHAILLKQRGAMSLEVARAIREHARNLEALIALLHDREHTAVVAVTRAGSLPVEETTRLLAALDAAQLPCTDVVVNGRAEGKCVRCRHRAEAEERVLAGFAPVLEGRRVVEIPLAPAPPVGLKALTSFATSWRTREVQRPT